MILRNLASWKGVIVATTITALCAVILAQILAYLLYPAHAVAAALSITPWITSMISFPFCLFVWAQVRHNIELRMQLQQMLNRDKLTDVATRDYFFHRMKKDEAAVGVSLMVDIDHFKRVNDTFGHFAGDQAIKHVADILRQNIRADDIVCRFGGEEFVIFLAGQNVDRGYIVAERIRKQIAGSSIVTEYADIAVTVSIGGASKPVETDIVDALKEADQALYQAKNKGRNQTIFAGATDLLNAA